MLGAEAEAVRISRLVGLVCCECHIATFFFANLLGTMVFLFHADNNVSEFLDTQHRTARFFGFVAKGVAHRFSHCAQHGRQWRAKVPLWQVAVFSSTPGLGSAVAGLAGRTRP